MIKPKLSFIIGSNVFFNNFEDFKSKDIDELYIISEKIEGNKIFNMKLDGKDIFLCPNMSKEDFIKTTLESNDPIKVGKFLVPDFIKYIDLTISDLKKLDCLFGKLDDKHKYEQIIYESYITNNDFILTENQLKDAYLIYKQYR